LGWIPDPSNAGTGFYKYWSKAGKRMVDPQPRDYGTGLPCDIWPTVLVPDYYNSLDACAEFERTLPGDAVDYCEKLCEVTGAEPSDRVFLCREVITATAPQRCEAYLKSMNLWRDA
jgi:hypothetical protein